MLSAQAYRSVMVKMACSTDIEGQFRASMAAAGIETNEPILGDGRLHRFYIKGDRRGTKNGFYRIFVDDIPAGVFGTWKGERKWTWCSKDMSMLTERQRADCIERVAQANAECARKKRQEQIRAKRKAQRRWQMSKPASDSHPYLKRKRARAYGTRVWEGSLLVPVQDPTGEIQSLQIIYPNGEKRFLAGGRKSGCFYIISESIEDLVYIGEGLATCSTIHDITDKPVVVAFDAGNLKSVAQAIRRKYPLVEIIIAGDNDINTEGNPGKKKAHEAARAVDGLVALPRFRNGQEGDTDFNDLYILEGKESVMAQLQAATTPITDFSKNVPQLEPEQDDLGTSISGDASRPPTNRKQKKPKVEDVLSIFIGTQASTKITLFTNQYGEPWARIPVRDHFEIVPIHGENFRDWLAWAIFQRFGVPVSDKMLDPVILALRSEAKFGETIKRAQLENRTAWGSHGNLFHDLTDERWQAIHLSKEGWECIQEPPILFRRHSHQKPQVIPERISLSEAPKVLGKIFRIINVSDIADQLLLSVYITCLLLPEVPHPILVLHGPHGCGKTTTQRKIRMLVDPSAVPILSLTGKHEEFVQQLDHHWCSFYDNVSYINGWQQDLLCRAVSGEGFVKRKLYSDNDDVLFSFRRCVSISHFRVPHLRADFLDRSLILKMDDLANNRKTEAELMVEFEALRPQLLGAMIGLLVGALNIDPIKADKMARQFRLADWASWGWRVAESLGGLGTAFIRAYADKSRNSTRMNLESNSLALALLVFMDSRKKWSGPAKKLLDELRKVAKRDRIDTSRNTWPANTTWLGRRLSNLRPDLAATGISCEPDRRSRERRYIIKRV